MAANDLTTVARVQNWLAGNAGPVPNPLLYAQEITRLSGVIQAYLNRGSLLSKTYNDIYDGRGGNKQMLRNWPITKIISLVINNVAIQPSPPNIPGPQAANYYPPGAGYVFEQWDGNPLTRARMLELRGFGFGTTKGGVSVSYVAGYLQQNEEQAIPTNGQITPIGPQGLMAADAGVTYVTSGLPLTPVASAPTVGQYIPPSPFAGDKAVPYYQFNTGESGTNVYLNYSFIPWAIEGVCCEWVAERLSYRTRIGAKSKSLGGQETMSWDTSAIPKFLQLALDPFRDTAIIL